MIELPTERQSPVSYNPKLMVLYGRPKSGKSSIMASLDSNLIIDLEDGYRALSVMKVKVNNAQEIFEVAQAISNKIKETGSMPYRFITIDNASRLEEFSLSYAAQLYRSTPMGQSWGMLKDRAGNVVKDPKTNRPMPDPKADVRTLPNGSGYMYLRNAIKKLVDIFKPLCDTLILVAHVKDKQIKKDSEEMSEMTVDLAGKTGDIICGEADAIGYIFRRENKTIVSFKGGDDTLKEARPLHLRGKEFEVAYSDDNNELHVDCSKIFINN